MRKFTKNKSMQYVVYAYMFNDTQIFIGDAP